MFRTILILGTGVVVGSVLNANKKIVIKNLLDYRVQYRQAVQKRHPDLYN